MRWVALAVIGAALMVHGQETKPHGNTDAGNTTAERSHPADTTRGQTVVVVNQQAPQGQQNDHSSKAARYLRELLVPANAPNLALVLVGIGGIIVAVCTLKKIEREIGLQEANFQQWIEVKKWTVVLPIDAGKNELEMAFDIVNSTDWPLTPLSTYVKIGAFESLRRHDVLLAPKQPYTVSNLFVAISPEWKRDYIAGRSPILPALILFTYRNCLKRVITQDITGVIHFKPLAIEFQLMDLPNLRAGEWYKKAKEGKQGAN